MPPAKILEKITPPVTQNGVNAFIKAIDGIAPDMPLSFPTLFRDSEFAYLDWINIPMKDVLHTEQEYEYIAPIPGEAPIQMRSVLLTDREKAGLRFVAVSTEILSEGRL